jgi:hypothetical protein
MASISDFDARKAAVADAREKALREKTTKNQINAYWSAGGPVPPLHCEPVTDFIEAIAAQNRCIALILDGAGVPFDWTDPPTEQTVAYNLAASARWKAIQRPKWRG